MHPAVAQPLQVGDVPPGLDVKRAMAQLAFRAAYGNVKAAKRWYKELWRGIPTLHLC